MFFRHSVWKCMGLIFFMGCGGGQPSPLNPVTSNDDGSTPPISDGGETTPPLGEEKCPWGQSEADAGTCAGESSVTYFKARQVARAFNATLLAGDGRTLFFEKSVYQGGDWLPYIEVYSLEFDQWRRQTDLYIGSARTYITEVVSMASSENGDVLVAWQGSTVSVWTRTAGIWSRGFISNTYPFWARIAVAVSPDGRRLAIGNPLGSSVDVLRRSTDGWTQEGQLKASNGDTGDALGFALAFSQDGQTLMVSAIGEDGNGISGPMDNSVIDSGAVYAFERTTDSSGQFFRWSETAYIKPEGIQSGDRFGVSIALSSGGNTLLVGADGEDSVEKESGAAYVFDKTHAGWKQRARLKANQPVVNDNFGRSVALSGNGRYAIVGSPNEDGCSSVGATSALRNCFESGAAYLFRLGISDLRDPLIFQ